MTNTYVFVVNLQMSLLLPHLVPLWIHPHQKQWCHLAQETHPRASHTQTYEQLLHINNTISLASIVNVVTKLKTHLQSQLSNKSVFSYTTVNSAKQTPKQRLLARAKYVNQNNAIITHDNKTPIYHREDRTMLLYISTCIEIYRSIAWFSLWLYR